MRIKLGNILILLILQAQFVKSQYSYSNSDNKEFITFINSKVLKVVLTGNNLIDEKLKEAIENNWVIRPVEYIKAINIDNEIANSDFCFLLFGFTSKVGIDSLTTPHFGIISGGRKSIEDYTTRSFISYVPLDQWRTEKRIKDAVYRFPLIISSLQKTLQIIETKKFTKTNPYEALSEFYFESTYLLGNKTLLINSAYGLSTEEISKVYENKFEVCNQSKIAKAIMDKNEDYAILQLTNTSSVNITVYDCKNFNCLYAWSESRIGFDLKKIDLKRIMKKTKFIDKE